MTQNHRHSAYGFTLIELIAVCAILAIVAGSVSAAMSNLTRQREVTAARQVQRDISYARERAVATGLRTWVVFNASTDTYDVRVESIATPGYASATILTDPATNKPFNVALNRDAYQGVDLMAANFDSTSTIGFDFLGRPLISSGASLAALGSVTLSGSNVVNVQIGSGSVTYTAP